MYARICYLLLAVILAFSISAVANAQNYALLFDGQNDYAEVVDNPSLDFTTGTYTIEGWFKTSSYDDIMTIISKWNFGEYEFLVQVRPFEGTQRIECYLPSVVLALTSPSLTVDTWYNFAMQFDGVDEYALYLNGELVDTYNDDPVENGTANLRIGAHMQLQSFNGAIDEIMISNIERHSNNYDVLYGYSLDGHTIALWHFDEGTGTIAHDESNYHNDASLYNGTTWTNGLLNPFDPVFTQRLVGGAFPGARAVYAIDVDGDNDMDVLGASYNGHEIAWWENDGLEHFTRHTIGSNFVGAHSVYAVDLDGDGDIDVLGAADLGDRITWWENDGNENFTEHDIAQLFDGAMSVYAADFDNDGDLDVVGAARYADEVAWWENDGNENFTEHTVAGFFDGARSVYAVDLNNDGYMDILGAATSANAITWWENNGDRTFTGHTITGFFFGAQSVYAADLNNDGNMDVVGSAMADGLRWWENDGNENFTPHSDFGDFTDARSVYATDMDRDGDIDVLSTGEVSGVYAWWENDGHQPPTFNMWTIDQEIYGPNSVFAADIDSDGDVDVLGTRFFVGSVLWWESEAAPPPPDSSLTISATPWEDPLVIPANGGVFRWDVVIENVSDAPYQFDAWTEAIVPNGHTYGPLVLFEGLMLQPGDVLQASPVQSVPAYAASGTYTYVAKVGDYPYAIASDEFYFEKLPPNMNGDQGQEEVTDWSITGWFDDLAQEDISAERLPAEFGIDRVYPNPFNPVTTVRISLPTASNLQVKVYNVRGRQVQVLASGRYAAGYRAFTFDGGNLASGIYFVQATVSGKLNEMRKIVLVK